MIEKECITMKHQLITEITRQMLSYLDNSQIEKLQGVLLLLECSSFPCSRIGAAIGERN